MLASTAIYKWVDEEGRVHYSDQPPPDTESEQVPIEPGAPRDSVEPGEALQRVLEKAEADRARRAEERQTAAAAEQVRQTERRARDAACAAARTRLAVLQEQRPVYRDEAGQFRVHWERRAVTYSGEREYLDDSERDAEIGRARNDIAANCADPGNEAAQERAKQAWLRSEMCATVRVELDELERPSARTPESEIENKRADVEFYCGN